MFFKDFVSVKREKIRKVRHRLMTHPHVTALRCSEPHAIRLAGIKALARLCGMGPLGCYGDQLAIILLKVGAWRGLAG